MAKQEKKMEFDCPMCGNPLFKDYRWKRYKCKWCHNVVEVPVETKYDAIRKSRQNKRYRPKENEHDS